VLRPELRETTHSLDSRGGVVLRPKEEVVRALRYSPDLSDALAMTFAFPHS